MSESLISRRRKQALPLLGIAVLLHAAAILVCVAAGESLLAGVAATSASVVFLLIHGWISLSLQSLSLAACFVTGQLTVFGVFHAIYYHLTDMPRGNYHDVAAWLAAAMCWSTVVGALLANRLLGPAARNDPQAEMPELRSWQALAVTGFVFGLLVIGMVQTGFLDARWQYREGSFGLAYVTGGVGYIGYAFFVVLGARLQPALLAPRNTVSLVLVALAAVGNALGGGREGSLWIMILFWIGANRSALPPRTLGTLTSVGAVAGILMMVAVGAARTNRYFAFEPVENRLASIGREAQGVASEDKRRKAYEGLVSRVYQFPAQVVIDQSIAFRREAGFEDFDRLQHLFLPKYLVPEKKHIEIGREVLVRDYGFRLNDTTSVPITLLADAFRRGRWTWVVVVGFLAGVWLRVLASLTLRVLAPGAAAAVFPMLALLQLRAYAASVTGFIASVTYGWAKYVIIVGATFMLARLLTALTDLRDHTRQPT
ncbi:MAG: hypothetical protein OXU20_01450 [Myxococcales bacterium]|nr:hypothetical protein [Myxococcales bacterium]